MAITEKELQYVKKERFLQNKPSTMYPNPYRLQFFHDSTDGPHGITSIFLNFFYDTNTVHMAPLNPLGTFYYQLDALLEYHPHICVGEGYGALVLYHLLINNKYDGNSVLLNMPLNKIKSLTFPKKGKHVLVFYLNEENKNAIEQLFSKSESGVIKETDLYVLLKKGNVSVYLLKIGKDKFVNIDSAKANEFTLKRIMEKVCDKDLTFSRLQDKGPMWFNSLYLAILFLFTLYFCGQSAKKQREDDKKEN